MTFPECPCLLHPQHLPEEVQQWKCGEIQQIHCPAFLSCHPQLGQLCVFTMLHLPCSSFLLHVEMWEDIPRVLPVSQRDPHPSWV